MEIGSPEWQLANNVRPNGRGGWISNEHRGGTGSFLGDISKPDVWLPFALMAAGGLGAQALGTAAGAAAGGGVPNLAGAAGLPGGAAYGAAASAPMAAGVPALAGAAGLPGGAAYSAAARAPNVAGGSGPAAGNALTSWLTRLRQYAPLALGGISAYKGLTQGPTDAENQLNEILGIAKNRVSASEPLFNELNASAMGDADRMRSRQAQADPMFEMLSKMTRSQMPRYTREG